MQEIFHVHTYRCKHASDDKDSDFRKAREHLGCFSAMIEGVKTGLFDCVAHPDRCFKRCKEWTSEMENLSKELINAALEKDISLEINIGSYIKLHKKIFWKKFWALVENHNQISDKKIKTIIGMDSHSTEEMKDRVEVAKTQNPTLIMSSTKNPQALIFQQRTNLAEVEK